MVHIHDIISFPTKIKKTVKTSIAVKIDHKIVKVVDVLVDEAQQR